jgi:hypothetical protein
MSRCLAILRCGSAVTHSTVQPHQVWRCCPFWALASPKKRRHSFLSPARLLHPRIPGTFNASLWTTSALRVLNFPTDVKFPRYRPRWPRGWVEVQLYPFLAAALEGGEWSTARPNRTLPPGKTRYPLYRRLGCPQGQFGQRKISPHRDSVPGPSSP